MNKLASIGLALLLVFLFIVLPIVFLLTTDSKERAQRADMQQLAKELTDQRFRAISRSEIVGHTTIYIIIDSETKQEYKILINGVGTDKQILQLK